MTTALLRTAALRAVEARFADAEPPLMERAGVALAAKIRRLLPAGRPLLIVAGPGNNGGDGLVAAHLLQEQGIEPTVVRAADDDIPEAAWGLAVDALFGIGLARPVAGRFAAMIDRINGLACPVLAVDIPSGLCADTGRVLGAAVRATTTLTFIAGKPGLHTLDGPDHCGEVIVDDLGLDPVLEIGEPEGRLVSPDLFRSQLRPRPRNTHKGRFGSVGVIGGAPGMAGAALLAGRAALKLGAGRVFVGMLERLAVDPLQPELMLRPAGEVFAPATALAVGPGLGQSANAVAALRQAVAAPLPLVLDADALNLLAAHPVLAAKVSRRHTPANAPTILTPHPAEAGRLLGLAADAVQADRIAAAIELAGRFRAHVVLKGCGTVIATPDGRWFVNPTGNPGLASAGTGDALTGMIAALLGQHWPAQEAVLAAVHLHGTAADALAASGSGPVGLTAGELIDTARTLFNRWIANA